MLHSIRARIGLPYVLLIAAVVLGLGFYFTATLNRIYLQTLESELIAQARLAGAELAPRLAGGANPDEIDALARTWSEALDKRITIIAPDGEVIGESQFDREAMENHAGRPEVIQARLSGQGTEIRHSDTLGVDMLYGAVPIQSGGEIVGFARLAMPLAPIDTHLAQVRGALLAGLAAASLLAAALAIWIAGRTTRPVRLLAEAAAQAAQGRFETRLIPTSRDEIGRLTEEFNHMTAQLGEHIQALDAERSRLAAVLEGMSDGVLIVDADGQVQLVNAAAQAMFSLNGPETAGRSLIELLRNHQIHELWEACRRQGMTQSAVIEMPGSRLYLQVIATPLGREAPGNILLLFQNLTRLRRLETVRQDFVSNISHELRTPLASLKALTETLQDGALDDPPAARRFLDRMVTEVDALTQMVAELLELTRIESGRVPLQMAPVHPEDLIAAAVERLGMQAERAGLELIVSCPPDLPPALADARRLEQVLVNLLHNAIKFTPSGGQITLKAEPRGEQIVFSVQDTGMGIPALDLVRIFERFYKSDRSRATGGTGLGLAIARHLVEAHGGKIWAESVEGQGSIFYFSIPVAK